jgi:hypothetical protein
VSVNIEYGIFGDEGCVEAQLYSKKQAEASLSLYRIEADGGEEFHYAEICPEHEEQEKDYCEECNEEEDN